MTAEPVPAPPPANVFSVCLRFLRRARPYAPRIALTLVIVFIATGAKTVQGFLIAPVIDVSKRHKAEPVVRKDTVFLDHLVKIPNPKEWDIQTIAMLAVVLSVVMFVFGSLRDYLTNWLTNRMVADLRNDVADHLAHLPLRFHNDRKLGDLVSRTTNDVTLTEMITNFLLDDALVHPIMVCWALAGAFYTNWKLASAALVFFPVYVFVLARIGRRMRRARKKSLESLGDMTGTMIQTFGGIKTVKAFNTEAQQVAEFKEHNENYFRRVMTALGRKALGDNLNSLFMGLAVAVILIGGYQMFESGELTAGQFAFFGLAVAMINSSVREMSKSYGRMVDASTGAERVFWLLDQQREEDHAAGEELPKVSSVEFKDVTFSYNSAPVLQGVTLSVQPG
ncbi:MAG TPA: ABC transporter ATP-binding protein, partial [Planctomycetota bacterium]|nr:ABC transporter ATP-binding protein [Planctomycetota bacterium]